MPRFELKGKVSLDGSKWKAGLNQAEAEVGKFSTKIAGRIGTAIKASLIGAVVSGVLIGVRNVLNSLSQASRIRDLAKRIGVTPEKFQQLDYAGKQSGSNGEQIVAAIKGLAKTQQRANETVTKNVKGKSITEYKDPALRSVFAKFGIGDKQLNLPTVALFQEIADKVKSGANAKDRSADLQRLMEEAGDALVPVFLAGLREAGEEARREGLIVSNKDILDAAAIDDAKTKNDAKTSADGIRAAAQNDQEIKDILKTKSQFERLWTNALGTGAQLIQRPLDSFKVDNMLKPMHDMVKPLGDLLQGQAETNRLLKRLDNNTEGLK